MTFLRRWRGPVLASVDSAAWLAGLCFAILVRYDFQTELVHARALASFVVLAAVAQSAVGALTLLYRGRYRVGSFDEVAGLAVVAGVISGMLLIADLAGPERRWIPASVPIAGGMMALLLMAGVRFVWRMYVERCSRPGGEHLERVLIFGAGDGGHQVIRAMLQDPESAYLPVGLIDDAPQRRNLRISGVPVLGDRRALKKAARAKRADALIIAMPSADAVLLRELSSLAEEADLAVKVVPSFRDLLDSSVGLNDIRDLDVSDLLGRHQIDTDLDSIAGYLTGKRVLVTGAGGSIGSELCRQIQQYGPDELIMLDRDESALHAVKLDLSGRALLDTPDLVLADIRDIEHMHALFMRRRPHVVFHAAALKHLTLLERYPGEAVKSNVWGTLTVLEAARAAGVERFVNISTDKAANPTSVLGYSKRIAERLTAHVAEQTGMTYLSVRFGNVLGSRGSVLTSFAAQIGAGGPVTITDPDVTRYFMLVQEAVQLVIQAGAIGRGGEALVLDMGKPVRIAEVARLLIGLQRRQVRIVYTGLRPGEKLHEDLLGAGERDERPLHPLISHVEVPPLDPLRAREMDAWAPADALVEALRRHCPPPSVVLPEQPGEPSVLRPRTS